MSVKYFKLSPRCCRLQLLHCIAVVSSGTGHARRVHCKQVDSTCYTSKVTGAGELARASTTLSDEPIAKIIEFCGEQGAEVLERERSENRCV